MSNWMMYGLIFWLVLIAITGALKNQWWLALYGISGAILNIAVLGMGK